MMFLSSSFCFYLGQRQGRKWNLAVFLGILFPSMLAAYRDSAVGTDTEMYKYIYNNIINWRWGDFFGTDIANVEAFYFLSSKIGSVLGGFSVVLFIYQFLNVLFLYLVCFRYRKYTAIWLCFLMYYCFFFPYSLNIMRQVTAVFYLLWICKYLFKEEYFKYCIGVLIGVAFHSSIVLGGTFIWIIYYSFKLPNRKKLWFILGYVVLLIVLFIGFRNIGYLLEYLPIGRLSKYANHYIGAQSAYISNTDILYRVFFFLIIWFTLRFNNVSKKYRTTYIILAITEIILICLGIYNESLYRLALYITAFYLLIIPVALKMTPFTSSSKLLVNTLWVMMCIVYWWYTMVYRNTNETIPYQFS